MIYSVIFLMAGKSQRFQENSHSNENKVFYLINNKPLFMYSLEVFFNDNNCNEIIIVCDEQEKLNEYDVKNMPKIVITSGGKARYQSVQNGLKHVSNDYVLVHDGARPIINKTLINNVLDGLKNHESVSPAIKVTDTIKYYNEKIETVNRDHLYYVQTPQGCKTSILKEALNKVTEDVTDDLMAIEKYTNVSPFLVQGSKMNVKVTTFEDIEIIRLLLGDKNV